MAVAYTNRLSLIWQISYYTLFWTAHFSLKGCVNLAAVDVGGGEGGRDMGSTQLHRDKRNQPCSCCPRRRTWSSWCPWRRLPACMCQSGRSRRPWVPVRVSCTPQCKFIPQRLHESRLQAQVSRNLFEINLHFRVQCPEKEKGLRLQ